MKSSVLSSINCLKRASRCRAGDCALLDYLHENDVKITSDEFEEAVLLSAKFNVDKADLNHLKELIE